jgi:uncharacterized protein YjiS (DUF1127 family)
MSTFATNTTSQPSFGGIFAPVSNMVTTVTKYHMYRKTVKELNQLSSNELVDLGLNRHSIKSVAMEAVYGA